MPSFSNILAFIRSHSAWIPYFLVVALLFIVAKCASDAEKSSVELIAAKVAIHSSDSIAKTLKDSIAHDTTVITDTLTKYDTIKKIRTLILAKVDSDWMHADSAIALVPASDSACHTAYNGLKAGCELLKTQVKNDSVEMNSLASTLSFTRTSLSSSLTSINTLQSQLKLASKLSNCKILFISCPSRTLSFFLGIGLVEAARIGVGKP